MEPWRLVMLGSVMIFASLSAGVRFWYPNSLTSFLIRFYSLYNTIHNCVFVDNSCEFNDATFVEPPLFNCKGSRCIEVSSNVTSLLVEDVTFSHLHFGKLQFASLLRKDPSAHFFRSLVHTLVGADVVGGAGVGAGVHSHQ